MEILTGDPRLSSRREGAIRHKLIDLNLLQSRKRNSHAKALDTRDGSSEIKEPDEVINGEFPEKYHHDSNTLSSKGVSSYALIRPFIFLHSLLNKNYEGFVDSRLNSFVCLFAFSLKQIRFQCLLELNIPTSP